MPGAVNAISKRRTLLLIFDWLLMADPAASARSYCQARRPVRAASVPASMPFSECRTTEFDDKNQAQHGLAGPAETFSDA